MIDFSTMLPSRKAWGFVPTAKKGGTFASGNPYLDGNGHPKNEAGVPYEFLFQIDLSEVEVQKLDIRLPSEGFLQFFVSGDTENYDYGSIYSPEYMSGKDTLARLLINPTYTDEKLTIQFEQAVHQSSERFYYEGSLVDVYPSCFGLEADETTKNMQNADRSVWDEYCNWHGEVKPDFDFTLGGYQNFVQDDFRYFGNDDNNKQLEMLFASSSNASTDNLMWGDCGSAGFWIQKTDLDSQKYSEAFLYVDCH